MTAGPKPSLPNVAILAEAGMPNFEAEPWQGIVAPVGTPSDYAGASLPHACPGGLATGSADQARRAVSHLSAASGSVQMRTSPIWPRKPLDGALA